MFLSALHTIILISWTSINLITTLGTRPAGDGPQQAVSRGTGSQGVRWIPSPQCQDVRQVSQVGQVSLPLRALQKVGRLPPVSQCCGKYWPSFLLLPLPLWGTCCWHVACYHLFSSVGWLLFEVTSNAQRERGRKGQEQDRDTDRQTDRQTD